MSTQIITQESPMDDIGHMPVILPAVIEQTASRIFESFSERLKERLNGRQERALKLAIGGHVMHKSGRIYSVRSENNQHAYLVDLDRGTCTCPDCGKGHICKHRIAAYLVEQAQQADKSLFHKEEIADEQVEKTRLVLDARSDVLREAIIYASLLIEGNLTNVEVIALEGDVALVRALPILKDGKLAPHFPFQGHSSAQVLAHSLADIAIYR
jgi:hypothetical protein